VTTIPRLLFIPSVVPERGLGHLNRCREAAWAIGAALWAPEGRPDFVESELWVNTDPLLKAWDAIVFDRRASEPWLVRRFQNQGIPLIGWDEGGELRSEMDFLVDSLGNTSTIPPNLNSLGLMDLGKFQEFKQNGILNVLVAFGATDRFRLAEKILRALNTLPDPGWNLTILESPFQDRSQLLMVWGRKPEVLSRPPRLRDHLRAYDLVFCSYGLTAHEALHQGVPVLLLEPSRYHARLSHHQGWPVLGVRRVGMRRLRHLLYLLQQENSRQELYPRKSSVDEPHFVWKQWRSRPRSCPACGSFQAQVVNRQKDRTFYRCLACGFLYLKPWLVSPKSYGQNYFEQEYQTQYGRTYLQDFDNIRQMGLRRLGRLEGLAGNLVSRTLLDLGCAFGPFLQAAREKGLLPHGADINPQAVTYVQNTLNFPCQCIDMTQADWSARWSQPFDVVSLWYVIEHFENLEVVLRGLQWLVKPGGWLLLSTPNASGLSARFLRQQFFSNSPSDHFTLWEPKTARLYLRRRGFEVRHIESTGIHPQRLWPMKPDSLAYRFWSNVQRRLGLGDTMEIYARRVP
jgi:2-polyprenyl-3-methyl-5-hydroxy-6-metoxy-1,4-benzoquinol methylase